MVAAHPSDLRAAAACGLRTAFVPRPQEHGPERARRRRRSTPAPTSSPPTSWSSPSCSSRTRAVAPEGAPGRCVARAKTTGLPGRRTLDRRPGRSRTESYCRVIVIGTLMAVGALAGPISTSPW